MGLINDVVMFVDTGIDDAVAIILSAFDRRTNLKAIVACQGNSGVDDVATKTFQVLDYINKDIPVFKGFEGRIADTNFKVTGVHGEKGKLGGFDFPKTTKKAKSFSELLDFFKNLDRKVDLLCIAPLSTLAKLLLDNPELKEKICHVYFQGGLLEDPNYVGYNVAYDPKALQVVLDSGVRVIICPSDFGHRAYLTHKEVAKLKDMNKTGAMLEYVFRSFHDRAVGDKGIATHDGVVSFLVRHWGFFWMKKAHIYLEYNGDGYGILKFDFKGKPKNAKVCTILYSPKFKRFLFRAVKNSCK